MIKRLFQFIYYSIKIVTDGLMGLFIQAGKMEDPFREMTVKKPEPMVNQRVYPPIQPPVAIDANGSPVLYELNKK